MTRDYGGVEIAVEGYADLVSDRKLAGRDADLVAQELTAYADVEDGIVAWVPEWILDEKDIDTVGRSEHVVSGRVDAETDKAYLVVSGHADAWLPKSVIRVYRLTPGLSEIHVPQRDLGAFAGGDS